MGAHAWVGVPQYGQHYIGVQCVEPEECVQRVHSPLGQLAGLGQLHERCDSVFIATLVQHPRRRLTMPPVFMRERSNKFVPRSKPCPVAAAPVA